MRTRAAIQGNRSHTFTFALHTIHILSVITSTCLAAKSVTFAYSHIPRRDWRDNWKRISNENRTAQNRSRPTDYNCVRSSITISPPTSSRINLRTITLRSVTIKRWDNCTCNEHRRECTIRLTWPPHGTAYIIHAHKLNCLYRDQIDRNYLCKYSK